MNLNDAVKIFTNKKFIFMRCNQPNIAIFFKPANSENVDVCILIDNSINIHFSKDQLEDLYDQVERKLIFNGYRNIKCHYIILTEDISRDRCFSDSPFSFWLIDNVNFRLIIYDNQPDDFLKTRSELEDLLISDKSSETHFSIKNYPFMTIFLVLINIIVFFIFEFIGDTENSSFMLAHGASYWKYIFEDNQYYRLLTCTFLHFGSEHLINNMISLIIIGNEVEKISGHLKFTLIYILSGLGSSLISAIYYMQQCPDELIVSAGASGCIFGILGALLILVLMKKELRHSINPANLTIIVVLSILNGYSDYSIDNMAHISGLMIGIIITFISCLYKKNVIK